MQINKDTKLYFSVSAKPGNFGATLYNVAFDHLGINAIYKPITIAIFKDSYNRFYNFHKLIDGLAIMGASGLSVSMPFKKEVMFYDFHSFLNKEIGPAQKIGNANTVVFNRNDKNEIEWPSQCCYNTDWMGFLNSCNSMLESCSAVVIVGSGAVSDSIAYALDQIKKPYVVINRSNIHTLKSKAVLDGRMLVNATPIGMDHVVDDLYSEDIVDNFDYVCDVVVKQHTNLIGLAKKMNKKYVQGWEFSREQLKEQFRIYTGQPFPDEIMNNELMKMGFI